MTIKELIEQAKQQCTVEGVADLEYMRDRTLRRMPTDDFVGVLRDSGLLAQILDQRMSGSTVRNYLIVPYLHAAVMAVVEK